MSTRIQSARIAGVLLISATTASLVGSALLAPTDADTGALAAVHAASGRVLLGALFAVTAALCSACIALAFYPVLRPYEPGLAIGSVALRVLEAALYVVAALGPILLVVLADQAGGATSSTANDGLTEVLSALRHQAGILGALAFYVGGGMYYVAFLRTRLLPRWLAGWGLVAVVLGLVAGVLVVLGLSEFGSPLMLVLNLPIFAQEMVMAGWLLVRGFTTPTGVLDAVPDRYSPVMG